MTFDPGQHRKGRAWRNVALLVTIVLLAVGTAYAVVEDHLRLDQNFPNPFNSTTEITYSIPDAGHVRLTVYNMLGKEVRMLVDEDKSRGEYKKRFEGEDLPSGQYSYTIVYTSATGTSKQTRKMYMVK